MNLLQQVVVYAVQERITVVESARDKCLDSGVDLVGLKPNPWTYLLSVL